MTLMYSTKKIAVLSISLLAIPVIAACGNNLTSQTPDSPGATVQPGDGAVEPGTSPTVGADADDNLEEVISRTPSLSTFSEVLDRAELGDSLEEGQSYTVFAPSDEAFAALPEETREALLREENRDSLRQLLSYHIVPQPLSSDQLTSGEVPTALEGESLNVQVNPNSNEVIVGNARVIEPDLRASNGVIHILDQIILPPNSPL
jgi:uncharacterized surface protein with fasciclin (FAS1) repeats